MVTEKTFVKDHTDASLNEALKSFLTQQLLSCNEKSEESNGRTIDELFEQWLNHISGRVKLSSYRKYELLYRTYIKTEFGGMRIKNINGSLIDGFAQKLLVSGKSNGNGLSAKTVNDVLTVLNLSFAYAEEEYGTFRPKISYIRQPKKEARVLSIYEENLFIEYLTKDTDIFKFGVLLVLFTGIRIGELCALKWENFTENAVKITATMQRLKKGDDYTEIIIGEPKTESSKREIPLTGFILDFVDRFRQPKGFVLSTDKIQFTEPRTMQYKFKRMISECGLPKTNFHALRHTFATRCAESGFDIKSLSEILGHSDVKITLNRYVHSSFELKRQNMDKMYEFMSK